MEPYEVLEREAFVSGLDEGPDGGLQLGDVNVKAEEAKGLTDLLDADHSIVVLVENIKDAAEAERIQTRAAEAEG